jgi:hypothetical protein
MEMTDYQEQEAGGYHLPSICIGHTLEQLHGMAIGILPDSPKHKAQDGV